MRPATHERDVVEPDEVIAVIWPGDALLQLSQAAEERHARRIAGHLDLNTGMTIDITADDDGVGRHGDPADVLVTEVVDEELEGAIEIRFRFALIALCPCFSH